MPSCPECGCWTGHTYPCSKTTISPLITDSSSPKSTSDAEAAHWFAEALTLKEQLRATQAKLEKANGLVAAYKMLSDGQGKLMQAFRTGVSPKESTFVKLRKAREALAAAIKETEGE